VPAVVQARASGGASGPLSLSVGAPGTAGGGARPKPPPLMLRPPARSASGGEPYISGGPSPNSARGLPRPETRGGLPLPAGAKTLRESALASGVITFDAPNGPNARRADQWGLSGSPPGKLRAASTASGGGASARGAPGAPPPMPPVPQPRGDALSELLRQYSSSSGSISSGGGSTSGYARTSGRASGRTSSFGAPGGGGAAAAAALPRALSLPVPTTVSLSVLGAGLDGGGAAGSPAGGSSMRRGGATPAAGASPRRAMAPRTVAFAP